MATTMKAMVIRRTGGPEVFEQAELPIPHPGANQVLVRVKATSVNPIDCKVRSGAVAILPPLPAVLHGDISGTVVEVGRDVSHFREGNEVFGFVGWTGGEGGSACGNMQYAMPDCSPMPQGRSRWRRLRRSPWLH